MNVIVTGAAGALGAAVVDALQRENHPLVLIDRVRSGRVEETFDLVADLSDSAQAQKAFVEAGRVLRSLDAVVQLVGAFRYLTFADAVPRDWRELFSANVETTVNTIRAALPHLVDGGSITCVGAASAQSGRAGMAAYAIAKSGVARLVESLADELRVRRIRVNAVAPGVIDTSRNRAEMLAADPTQWTSPEAIADVICFLASRRARAINGTTVLATNNA